MSRLPAMPNAESIRRILPPMHLRAVRRLAARVASWTAGGTLIASVLVGCGGAGVDGQILMATRDIGDESGAGQVHRLDLGSATVSSVWGLEALPKAWEVSRDGGQVAYVTVDGEETTTLSVRGVDEESADSPVVSLSPEEGAIWGIAWSQDGSRLAYWRSVGELSVSNPLGVLTPSAWRLHTVEIADGAPVDGSGEVLWELSGDDVETLVYSLEAWDSEGQRIAIMDRMPRLSFAHRVRVVDLADETVVVDEEIEVLPYHTLASSDGRYLLLPSGDREPDAENIVERLDLRTGGRETLYSLAPGHLPGWPIWSPDSRLVAWTEIVSPQQIPRDVLETQVAATEAAITDTPPPGESVPATVPPADDGEETPTPPPIPTVAPAAPVMVRVISVADQTSRMTRQYPDASDRAVAFAPDGSLVAILDTLGPTAATNDLHVLGVQDSEGDPLLTSAVPATAFFFEWLGGAE